jgi:hypothetical protein
MDKSKTAPEEFSFLFLSKKVKKTFIYGAVKLTKIEIVFD